MKNNRDFLDDEFVREITESQVTLRSYIWKMLGNYHSTEDVLQKTNMILWDKRMEWDPSTTFLKWAYRIAYFQCKAYLRDYRREKGRLVFDNETIDLLAENEPTFESMSVLQEALHRCLGKLDKKKRELLLKRYKENCSVEKLAQENNYTPNNLSQILRRLRIKLFNCIVG